MSANPYQLLLRHPNLLSADTLIVGANADTAGAWQAHLQPSGAAILTWDWQTYLSYAAFEQERRTFAVPEAEHFQAAKKIILLWPKSKVLALALLQKIAEVQSECWVVGENDAGGKSIHKAAHALITQADKADSARHCSLWHLQLQPQAPQAWQQQAKQFTYQQQSYQTLPGVFNHGKLDEGTALLLEHLPEFSAGTLLDLGCGSGVLGLSLKARFPQLQVTLADVDAFALASAQLNAEAAAAEVSVIASDGFAQIEERFDAIITNPPFHQGKDTNYEFAQQLFQQARHHLNAKGQLWLVANRHLNYEDWAAQHFQNVRIVTQERGFKVLCCQL